jgi:succinate-semialdehyde dehydrogenase/glutarate-semialdehyde dehydrogenase
MTTPLRSINPANGELLAEYPLWSDDQLEHALARSASGQRGWAAMQPSRRTEYLLGLAARLRDRREPLARVASLEMGKPLREGRAEIDKSVLCCEYYAENLEGFLCDEPADSDASRSLVTYQPLGSVLAIMPWNFPFWQVVRALAPIIGAGNSLLLKHAPNVPQCARALQDLIRETGLPDGVFINLPIDVEPVERLLADQRVHAVTLTGSETAGRAVAALAGRHLKKAVLELGGSDPFIVLEDADLDLAAKQALASRLQNAGQSCIAAKRLIVVDAVAERFVESVRARLDRWVPGNPLDEATTLGPLARQDLRAQLHDQLRASVDAGARLLAGGVPPDGPGFFYPASLLDRVGPGMAAYEQELFGPVVSILRVANEASALRVANDTRYGLGGSVWTEDLERGERLARELECGCAFVNGMTRSDPRLPFGGIKASGYGRELSSFGLREFTNAKTVWIR